MTPCRRSEEGYDASTIGDIDRAADWSLGAGYLSSFLALETGVGLQSCPWLVDVPPGRQVNVTLMRFSERWPGGGLTSGCEWTVVVREGNVTTHLPGCASGRGGELTDGGDGRQRVVYTSHRRGTPLSVYLRPTTTSSTLRSQLLLYFQGSLYFYFQLRLIGRP